LIQPERVRILSMMFVAVIALAIGEIALSKGMKAAAREGSGYLALASAGLRSPWLWAGIGLLVIHLGLYLAVLSETDLSFALPLTAASYPLSALLAKLVLHEEVGLARWAGTALITIGVAVVACCEAASQPDM
jgi:drug/metabolite transporter (DMT)-like permease